MILIGLLILLIMLLVMLVLMLMFFSRSRSSIRVLIDVPHRRIRRSVSQNIKNHPIVASMRQAPNTRTAFATHTSSTALSTSTAIIVVLEDKVEVRHDSRVAGIGWAVFVAVCVLVVHGRGIRGFVVRLMGGGGGTAAGRGFLVVGVLEEEHIAFDGFEHGGVKGMVGAGDAAAGISAFTARGGRGGENFGGGSGCYRRYRF